MIGPNAILIANVVLAMVLGSFWFNHMQRYKMKLLGRIAALDHKIEQFVKMDKHHRLQSYIGYRSHLKAELYRVQKLTNYSGFR